jgi:hypothetical protein
MRVLWYKSLIDLDVQPTTMRTGALIDLVESLRRMTRTTTDYPTLIWLKKAVTLTQVLQSASTVLRIKLDQLKLHKEQQHAFLVSYR